MEKADVLAALHAAISQTKDEVLDQEATTAFGEQTWARPDSEPLRNFLVEMVLTFLERLQRHGIQGAIATLLYVLYVGYLAGRATKDAETIEAIGNLGEAEK